MSGLARDSYLVWRKFACERAILNILMHHCVNPFWTYREVPPENETYHADHILSEHSIAYNFIANFIKHRIFGILTLTRPRGDICPETSVNFCSHDNLMFKPELYN